MRDNLQEAKEMFLKYNGSHFFMSREDDYEKYKSFNVTKEQELTWITEIQQDNISMIRSGSLLPNDIKNIFCSALSSIRTYKSIELFHNFVEAYKDSATKMDSFSKMIIAEEIFETVRSLRFSKDLQKNELIDDIRVFAVYIMKDILQNPIVVDAEYLKIDYLKSEVKESVMIKRIQRSLKEWDKQ